MTFDKLDTHVLAKQPLTVTFGPDELDAIQYFLMKPHHDQAQISARHALEEVFMDEGSRGDLRLPDDSG